MGDQLGDAARKWLASFEWQESERNYLADYEIAIEVRDAFDSALVSAFVAGAVWAYATPQAGEQEQP